MKSIKVEQLRKFLFQLKLPQVDTSESLRNLQQEIESLLAPLTPLPDLDQVECGKQNLRLANP